MLASRGSGIIVFMNILENLVTRMGPSLQTHPAAAELGM